MVGLLLTTRVPHHREHKTETIQKYSLYNTTLIVIDADGETFSRFAVDYDTYDLPMPGSPTLHIQIGSMEECMELRHS